MPTFKVNETSQSEFKKQVNATKSPFVEFVSEHYFATMQTDMIKNEVINSRLEDNYINAFVAGWDHGWRMTNVNFEV
ncbi:M60 family metallopeptidase [Spiroplasma poulsonii]|uniref:M60 family metallopeptidase n=1 Tax=Spiroplasma poulsonii TaxID=2138 RepID=UPI0038D505FE